MLKEIRKDLNEVSHRETFIIQYLMKEQNYGESLVRDSVTIVL